MFFDKFKKTKKAPPKPPLFSIPEDNDDQNKTQEKQKAQTPTQPPTQPPKSNPPPPPIDPQKILDDLPKEPIKEVHTSILDGFNEQELANIIKLAIYEENKDDKKYTKYENKRNTGD